jgi:hypothetical protein
MARGRSVPDYERVYIDGYDMSGYTVDPGERGSTWEEFDNGTTLGDACKGVLVGMPTWTFGPLNGVFDNTATSGIHVLANAAQGTRRNIMHIRGVRAVPAIGDDAFCAPMLQTAYQGAPGSGVVTASLKFAHDAQSGLLYANPFGAVLHTLTSETAANTANTNADEGAATAKGGWLMYQILSITGAGTVTISVDDSSTGTSGWAALTGATTGAIATATAPTSGFIQIGVTAAVKQYLRWQLALGGSATACTFALAFMRGRR